MNRLRNAIPHRSGRRAGSRSGLGLGIGAVLLLAAVALTPAAAQDGPRADLTASVDDLRATVTPGQNLTYVAVIANRGPEAVTGAAITGTIPAALNAAWTALATGSATVSSTFGTGSLGVTADIPPFQEVRFTVTGLLPQSYAGDTLSVTFAVEAPAGVVDPNPSNNGATDVNEVLAQQAGNVRPYYVNAWPALSSGAAGAPPSNGSAAFGGLVGARQAASNPRYVLKSSSFGQPLARYKSSPDFLEEALYTAQAELFYLAGNPLGINNIAAFRYINTFFRRDTVGAVQAIVQRLDDAIPYDATIHPGDGQESDEERALRVADDIIELLRFAPFDKELRSLLLDIYYYRTLGRQVAAKDQVVKAYQINFATEVKATDPFGGTLNEEIAAYENAANALSGVLDPYRDLFANNLGVNVGEYDAAYAGSVPFGYYLFQQEVPYRSVYAATFVTNDQGTLSGDPEAADGAPYAGILTATPSAFSVDAQGRPQGSAQARVSFEVRNVGGELLTWSAAVENPTVGPGAGDMLTLSVGTGSPLTMVSGELQGDDRTTVTVNIAPNTAPQPRVGKIRVEDTGGGTHGLVYHIVITQAANALPVLSVSPAEVQFAFRPSVWDLGTKQIVIRNAGMGTLRWHASVQKPQGDHGSRADWLKIYGDGGESTQSESISGVEGTDSGLLNLHAYIEVAPPTNNRVPVRVRIDNLSDPAAAPVYVSVYVGDEKPGADTVFPAKAGAALPLAVSPLEMHLGSEATEKSVLVYGSSAFPWTAGVASGGAWGLQVKSADAATGIVTLTIPANPSPQPRTGSIEIASNATSPATRTVTLYQAGTALHSLNVTPDARVVAKTPGPGSAAEQAAAVFQVRPTGDIAWTARVTQGQEWLSILSGASGQGDGEIRFSYARNTHKFARVGEITVTAPQALSGQDVVKVRVNQRSDEGTPAISSGFKDLALIFDVLRDEAQVKKELAKRYALRNLNNDLDKAKALIATTLARHTAALSEVGGIIPDWRKRVPSTSDLFSSFLGWQQAVAELNTTRDFLNGNTNVLGFPEDFLFLVQRFPGQPETLYDSFDKLLQYMISGDNNVAVKTSVLGYAQDRYDFAVNSYKTFATTQDQLRKEFREQNIEHRKWMFDVVGSDPGPDVDRPVDPQSYYNPDQNYGGEIWVKCRSIDQALERVKQNEADLDRIANQITTEIWRHGQEKQIAAQISDIHYSYQTQIADMELELAAIEGSQKMLDAIAEACAVDKPWQAIGHSINAAAQFALEMGKGELNRQKAQLAADENRLVASLESRLLDVNHQALLSNLQGEAAVVAVRSAELAIGLIQEVGERRAMVDEWHYRENLMRENVRALLNQSFSNPVHRLRMQRSMIEAETSFKTAQRWVFFAIRALEYKWNTPFFYTNESGTWSLGSLFRARTAKDLIDLLAAMREFDGLLQGSARTDDRFDWFSFKEDFMGLVPVYGPDGVTEVKAYTHPLTGYAATATDIFRWRLRQATNPETGLLDLSFNTVKDNGESFFRGPVRDPQNPSRVLWRGQYLDKIVWMKVNMLGDFAGAPRPRVAGTLTYGGGAYVRNAQVGTIPDLTKPNVVEDEFTLWSTKYWFFDSGMPLANPPRPAAWRSSNGLTAGITVNLVNQPHLEMPDSVSRIDTFAESSVACDNWNLMVFTRTNGQQVVDLEKVDDIEILFYHRSAERPSFAKRLP